LAARNPYSLGLYSITCPSGRVISGPPRGSYWRVSREKFDELDRDGRIWWGKDGGNVPAPKIFLSEVKQGVVPMTIWPYKEAGHTQDAKKELLDLVEFADSASVFPTPKPTKLLQRIVEIGSSAGDLLLDSFAGSGTTGQAVLQLNRAAGNGVPRRFIMIEMEQKIAREVAAVRVRRSAEGHTTSDGELVPGVGGGFRYCRLGDPLFDQTGNIRDSVSFGQLARHVYFTETGEPLPPQNKESPFLGACRGTGVYLLYNGILGDRKASGGNVLTRAVLSSLPRFEGQKVIYCSGCLLGKDRLQTEGIVIRQTPYQVRVS
jgi:adenine-specific DNA-methyltransferase